jgi:enterobactin synthetase component D
VSGRRKEGGTDGDAVVRPGLFPPFVSHHELAFEVGGPEGLAAQFPGIALEASLERAVDKRKAEFLAGRFCARAALRLIAHARADERIPCGDDRAPCWPDGIVGSITHTSGFACAAIARRAAARGIGIDAEQWIVPEQASDIVESIAARDEIAALSRVTRWPESRVLTLVFSAKESLFKCLYPEVRRYFDFRDAAVASLDPAGAFRIQLLVGLTPSLPGGFDLVGRFASHDRLVLTAIVRPA